VALRGSVEGAETGVTAPSVTTRPAPLGAVVRSAGVFGAAFVVTGVLLSAGLVLAARRRQLDADAVAGFAMAVYLVVVTAALNAIGFAAVTGFSRRWRWCERRRQTRLATGSGAVAFVIQLLGVHYRLAFLVQGIPWVGVYLLFALPGILAGLGGVVLARAPRLPRVDGNLTSVPS